MPRAKIFVDGACANNGRSDAVMGIGVYWYEPSDENNDISEPFYAPIPTNQKAEIEAARRGALQCKELGFDDVTIYTDSKYVWHAVNEYIPRWEKDGYFSRGGRPVINEEEFRGLKKAIDQIRNMPGYVDFKHIPSNENRADALAKRATTLANRRRY